MFSVNPVEIYVIPIAIGTYVSYVLCGSKTYVDSSLFYQFKGILQPYIS